MWKQPWTYPEGFTIASGLLIVGLMLQWSVGPLEWTVFRWPANIIVLAVYVLCLVAAYLAAAAAMPFVFCQRPMPPCPPWLLPRC